MSKANLIQLDDYVDSNGSGQSQGNSIAEQMLEFAPVNIMMADKNLKLTYLNAKSVETLKSIQHLLPKPVEQLKGESIDIFHKNPAQQRALLANPKNLPHTAHIRLGDEVLDLLVTALYDENHNYVGPMVTWSVITEKLKVENEMARNNQMLESAPVNIMMADLDLNLTYLNAKSRDTLKSIQHLLPKPADQLVGESIDIFHKNPSQQRALLSNPNNLPHKAKIQLGDEILDLTVEALYDANNQYVGPMVCWEVITETVRLVETLEGTSNDLGTSAEELLAVSTSMKSNSEETSAQAANASTASEQVNAGISTVVTNIEEMTASIKEITKSTNESSTMSTEATRMAKEANEIIQKLGDSSQDIGNVIKVISAIAQQTNLLALNATIEAARAGEAGKGFAVVANEVKELAKETAKATSEITKKIEAIQTDSEQAVTSISNVSDSIEKLNAISANIAASIEEQAASTNEVNRVVSDSASAVQNISENIQQVSIASNQTSEGAVQTNEAAGKLGELAETLKELVKKVKV